jgi:SlyX protein
MAACRGWGILKAMPRQDPHMTEDSRCEELELKLAYLERANQELSDVVYRQQQAIDQLEARLGRLSDRLEAIEARPRDYTGPEEAPPHY